MNQNVLENVIVAIAFLAGITISIGHNPLIGVVMLLGITTSIGYVSRFLVPAPKFAHSEVHKFQDNN